MKNNKRDNSLNLILISTYLASEENGRDENGRGQDEKIEVAQAGLLVLG
jgi:hypothetical protein